MGAAPGARAGLAVADVGGGLVVGPAPDAYVLRRPLDGVDAAGGVTPEPIALLDEAGGALPLPGDVGEEVVAVGSVHVGVDVLRVEVAAADLGRVVGVQGDAVDRLHVPALVDVELALPGPRVAKHPKCGPGTAHWLGEAREVGDEESLLVAGLALQTDTVGALAIGSDAGGEVGLHHDGTRLLREHTQRFGIVVGAVVDEALCGVNVQDVTGVKLALYYQNNSRNVREIREWDGIRGWLALSKTAGHTWKKSHLLLTLLVS